MLFSSGSPEYAAATSPHNASVEQRPAVVAVARSTDEVLEALTVAAARGLVVVPQATGHGAGAPIGDDVLLLDTSGLDTVEVDAATRIARVGAGATWGAVNAAAEPHGLLGRAGSSPTVAVCGYTFGGGIGWLVRRDGLASAALRSVAYADGRGAVRTAADDAPDALDREAVQAFRGGGGVGIATELEIDLSPVADLHCGRLLWPVDALDEVVGAWAAALPALGPTVASSIAVLHLPPQGPLPDELLGTTVVHLALADPDGAEGAADLLAAVRRAAPPALDDWGPGDAARLGTIHLDPPDAAPALGDARWLDESAPGVVADVLRTAAADDAPVVMLEVRHVAGPEAAREGVLVAPHSPYVVHAVGALGRAEPAAIADGIARAREAWTPADAGLTLASWVEGAAAVDDALAPGVRNRLLDLADRVDPDRRIRRPRVLGD